MERAEQEGRMIPFLNLKAQYETLDEEILVAIKRTLASTQWILGDEVAEFEAEFASYSGGQFGVGVNSGTSALHLALLAAGVGPGDEVITVANTFVATVAAIGYTGARPVFVDVDAVTLNMDVNLIERAITPRTKVILPVHLHGLPADLDPILAIARRHKLLVIEDAAQAHGASYRGKRVGSIGDMGCFSFYPGKNLGACGEGGMVVTDNPQFAKQIRMLRDWGQDSKYHHKYKGYNYRMEGLQGAILRVKLRYLDGWTQARRQLAGIYRELLTESGFRLPAEPAGTQPVYHVYAVGTPRRDAVQAALRERGIHTGIHYPVPVHLQQAYSEYGYTQGDLPVTETICSETLSLPMYAELPASDVVEVCSALRDAVCVEVCE
jgi:dTDP-4-amino-4,6-dideoxygalactose transaminase